jgi:hypothetical protein
VPVVQVLIIHSVLIRRKRRIHTARTKPPSSCCARFLSPFKPARGTRTTTTTTPPIVRSPAKSNKAYVHYSVRLACFAVEPPEPMALRTSERQSSRCALHAYTSFSFSVSMENSRSNSSLNSTLFSLFAVNNQSRQNAANQTRA